MKGEATLLNGMGALLYDRRPVCDVCRYRFASRTVFEPGEVTSDTVRESVTIYLCEVCWEKGAAK